MVDKGLEKVQNENNVGQKLHKRTAFHRWVDIRLQFATYYNKKLLSTAEMIAIAYVQAG